VIKGACALSPVLQCCGRAHLDSEHSRHASGSSPKVIDGMLGLLKHVEIGCEFLKIVKRSSWFCSFEITC
jgi:hypothetical protein